MKIRSVLIALLLIVSSSLFAQSVKTEKIKVNGNCESCKKHIETASKTAGANSADWNKTTKWLTVSYDPAKVSNEQIQKNISAAGYDTEKFKGDDSAYSKLDECCQYDRKDSTAKKN